MKTIKNIFIILSCVFMFTACENTNKTKKNTTNDAVISYKIAKNYFVKNTVDEIENPKIISQEDFDEIFGMATTMGEDGKPTSIDFSKEFVIAVILPETDISTELQPIDLIENEKNNLIFTYKKEEGEKLSHTIKPALILIVDNNHKGEVTLKEE